MPLLNPLELFPFYYAGSHLRGLLSQHHHAVIGMALELVSRELLLGLGQRIVAGQPRHEVSALDDLGRGDLSIFPPVCEVLVGFDGGGPLHVCFSLDFIGFSLDDVLESVGLGPCFN